MRRADATDVKPGGTARDFITLVPADNWDRSVFDLAAPVHTKIERRNKNEYRI